MIRPERAVDVPAIRAVHCAAFPTAAEANLVDALRGNGRLSISLAAFEGDHLVGHIVFSPVTMANAPLVGAGLAPIAVLPSYQRRGIGRSLIHEGIKACRASSVDYVVVLGDPAYYRRFGFETASRFGLANEYGVDAEFMAMELTDSCLSGRQGLVRFGDEFSELT